MKTVGNMPNLNLEDLEHGFGYEAMAVKAFKDRDGAAFASAGYSRNAMLDVVAKNWKALEGRGILSAALIEAIIGCKYNNHAWPASFIENLLLYCLLHGSGTDTLSAQGTVPDPADYRKKITLYRGVSGTGANRKIRGVCWTSDLDTACWFALRLSKEDPAVYTTKVLIGNVFCFYDKRGEHECIVRPKTYRRMEMSLKEMRAAEDRVRTQRHKEMQEHFAEIEAKRKAKRKAK